MKYMIESTKDGCIETIILSNGKQYTKRHMRTDCGSKTLDDEFYEQMERDGICEEALDVVCDTFDGFIASYFMDAVKLGL